MNDENIQTYSETPTEECPTQCEECKIYYSNGSCMIFSKNPKKTKSKLCKPCFDKLTKTKHLNR